MDLELRATDRAQELESLGFWSFSLDLSTITFIL